MKLYHGTSLPAFEQIKLDGAIMPRGDRPSQWDHNHPSHPDAVYLTDVFGPYFAVHAVAETLTPGVPAYIVLVEVDSDRLTELVPDEDWLEQSTRPKGVILTERMQRRTAACRRRLASYLDSDAWQASVKGMGTCAHLGPVPVTRAVVAPLHALPPDFIFRAMDGIPSIKGYPLTAPLQRRMTEALFASCPVWEAEDAIVG